VWADLGNHNAGLANAAQMGAATVCRHADGRLCLFVKNGGGGLSMKSQTAPGGAWGPWVDLGGTDVQDGVTAVAGPSGRIEVFAATRTRILHWYQTAPNSVFTANTALPDVPPSSPPTACLGPNGRLHLVYRVGAEVAVTSQTVVNGGWGQPVLSPGPGGHGQVAAVAYDGLVRLAARNADGGVSTAAVAPDGSVGGWESLGGAADVPALAADAGGQLAVFADAGQPAVCLWPQPGAWTPLDRSQ
jgi:hypothetical protein